jgi:hypothetical protein
MNLVAPDLNAIGLKSLWASYWFNLGGGEVRPGRLIRGALPTAGQGILPRPPSHRRRHEPARLFRA